MGFTSLRRSRILRHDPRLLALVGMVAAVSSASAEQSIQLSAFPYRSVADGRSTTTLTAIVRDNSGRPVPNGTRIVFAASNGATFRESIVSTENGVARAILIAGTVPGMARVTATSQGGNASPAVLDFEFVSDRKLLSSAQEYIEIVTADTAQYTTDTRVVAASAANQGVNLRYRDVQIQADDLQLDVGGYQVRARRAKLRIGKFEHDFDELSFRLNTREGFGTTSYLAQRADTIAWVGGMPAAVEVRADDALEIATERPKFGVVQVRATGFEPAALPEGESPFQFVDLSAAVSTIRAKKVTAFPQRGVQFQKAEVYVGTTKVLSMPLYELNQQAVASTPIITDQFVNVQDSTLAVNYPYYLSIKPGQTSLFRLRTGELYGRSTAANRGSFLDYELNWNRGDEMDGGITFSGIARNDWNLSARQWWQVDDRSSAFFQALTPAGQSMLGSVGYTRQFDGFQTTINANGSQNLRGLRFNSQDALIALERDPAKVGRLPATLSLGMNLSYNANSLTSLRDRSAGVYARLLTTGMRTPIGGTLTLSGTVRQNQSSLRGVNTAYFATASYFRELASGISVNTVYDFVQDGFDDRTYGSHRVSYLANVTRGRTLLQLNGLKSLTLDRSNFFADMSYRVGPLWRLGYRYTFDRFGGVEFIDDQYVLGYRLGWREVGLVYSRLTKRVGLQVVGATIF